MNNGNKTMTKKYFYTILLGSTALASSFSFNVMADHGIEPVLAYSALDMEKPGFLRKAWKAAPDLGVIKAVKGKVGGVLQNRAEAQLDDVSGELAKKIKSLIHKEIYRLKDRHVVGLDGENIGFVEKNDSRLVRSIIQKATGVELESLFDVGLGTKAVSKFLLNKLENYIAGLLEDGIQSKVEQYTHNAVMASLGMALNVGEKRLSAYFDQPEIVKPVKISLTSEKNIENADLQEELESNTHLQKLTEGIKAQISLWFLCVAEDTAHTLTDWAANEIMNKTAKEIQVGATTAGAIVAYSTGLGGLYALATSIDAQVSDANNPSYMGQFVDWAWDKEKCQGQMQSATETQARHFIHQAYGKIFGNLEDHLEIVHGKYAITELDDSEFEGWMTMNKASDGFSIVEEIADIGRDVVSDFSQKVSEVVVVVKDTVVATATVVKDVAVALPKKIEADNEYLAEVAENRGGGFLDYVDAFIASAIGLDPDGVEEEDIEETVTPSSQKSSWWNPLSW